MQWVTALGQLRDEILGCCLRKMFVEWNDQEMPDAQRANERDLVLRCSDQMWRIFRSQNLGRMRIEGHYHRRSLFRMGMSGGSRNDRLMPEVDAIKCADREKNRAGQARQLGNGAEDFH